MVFLTTTAAAVKAALGLKGDGAGAARIDPTDLDGIIAAVSGMAERLMRRVFLKAERTTIFSAKRNEKMLQLPDYPIVVGDPTPVFQIRESLTRDFASADSLISASDYYLDAEAGIVLMDVPFMGGAGTVQVKRTGGMAVDTAGFITAFPDYANACAVWAAEVWRRWDTQTVASKSSGRGFSESLLPLGEPPPHVAAVLGIGLSGVRIG